MPRPRPHAALGATIALLVVAAMRPASLHAQQPGQQIVPQQSQLFVTGYGEVAIPPDRATIDVAVETRASSASTAAAQNARRLRAVLDTLKARGVATNDIATLGYSVHPDYEPQPRGEAPRRSYVASNIVRIETRTLDQVGALLDAALAAGANRVNEVRFGSSRILAMRDSAAALAIASARRTAERMALAAGARLGDLVELSTEVGPYAMNNNVMRTRLAYAGGAAMTNQTSIAPDELMVGSTIAARWQLIVGR